MLLCLTVSYQLSQQNLQNLISNEWANADVICEIRFSIFFFFFNWHVGLYIAILWITCTHFDWRIIHVFYEIWPEISSQYSISFSITKYEPVAYDNFAPSRENPINHNIFLRFFRDYQSLLRIPISFLYKNKYRSSE